MDINGRTSSNKGSRQGHSMSLHSFRRFKTLECNFSHPRKAWATRTARGRGRAELNKCSCNSAITICAGWPQFHGHLGLHRRVHALGLGTKEGSVGEHQLVSSLRNTNWANLQEKVLKNRKGNYQRLGCIVVHQETMRWENTSPIHEPLPMIIFFNLILALRGYFRKDAWLVSCNNVMT